jgi:hypothetical protein
MKAFLHRSELLEHIDTASQRLSSASHQKQHKNSDDRSHNYFLIGWEVECFAESSLLDPQFVDLFVHYITLDLRSCKMVLIIARDYSL